ncbi:DUF4347 domain-containing protein [Flagellimonas sp.]|uniref:DUF4347 domain-containing protein n=1 Tax=Flagellimonas sp. TaxID=2058762 RepID=UPI003B505CEA
MKTNLSSTCLYLKGCFLGLIFFLPTLILGQSSDLVVIDGDFAQSASVTSKISNGSIPILVLNSSENPWKIIRQRLISDPNITTIHLFAEASFNSLKLGNIEYDMGKVDAEPELSMLEGVYSGTNLQLLIYNCNLASNQEGRELLKKIGDKAYFNIAAPTACNSIFDQQPNFDYTTLNQPVSQSILQN